MSTDTTDTSWATRLPPGADPAITDAQGNALPVIEQMAAQAQAEAEAG